MTENEEIIQPYYQKMSRKKRKKKIKEMSNDEKKLNKIKKALKQDTA